MTREKKSFGILILIVIFFFVLSIRFFFILTPEGPEEKIDETKAQVFKQSYSIFNGTDPEIIAENFANALNESPIRSKHKENCCGGIKQWNFELQNDNHFSIETRRLKNNNSILLDMRFGQSAYHEKNLSHDSEYAKNIVINFTEKFLKMFGVELGDDYTISVYSRHKNSS